MIVLLLGACAIATLFPLVAIVGYVAWQGVRRLDLALFVQLPPAAGLTGGGLGNAIVGTLVVVAIATVIAAPMGILAAIYCTEFERRAVWVRGWRVAVGALAGLPAIVAGVFAYGMLVASGLVGFSAIAGGAALAVVMLPLVARASEEALRQVPDGMRWEAAALGASPRQVVWRVVLPAALPGIVTGVALAIARAAGETAPLLFATLNSALWLRDLRSPTPTLAVTVYQFATSPFPAQRALAWAGALLLVAMVAVASLLARWTLPARPR